MTKMKIPFIPEDAPFSADQRSWLGGFLAGMHSRLLVAEQNSDSSGSAKAAVPLHILYGTQTGNSEMVATDAADAARAAGFSPIVEELDGISLEQLGAMKAVLVVVSTYGEGEMPDNAGLFWDAISEQGIDRLEELHFAVIGLGDTSYDEFCQAGKLIDLRFEQLGAKRLSARIDCDVDFEDVAATWIETVIPLASEVAGAAVAGAAGDAPKPAAKKSGYSRKNPYRSKVVENILLSGESSAKEIRHVSFALPETDMEYEAGDALSVMPINNAELVGMLIERLGVAADVVPEGEEQTLETLLTTQYEISTPSRDMISGVAELSGHEELNRLLNNNDKEALENFLWGRDTLDLLNLNADAALSVSQFMAWLKPLQHRAYSISSSPNIHNGEVHLTVAAVRWSFDQREHRGVASTYLADNAPEGSEVSIFMSPNKSFRVPADDTVPMIMVGPGTGIAPFRAFLEERKAREAKGENWLFFGDQHRSSDFIYEDQISELLEEGTLDRLDLAFSRDQEEKVYVQTRMKENSKTLFEWLEQGAYFYVCGDATRMARDVENALLEIISKEGGLSEEQTLEYFTAIKKAKRYLRDVY